MPEEPERTVRAKAVDELWQERKPRSISLSVTEIDSYYLTWTRARHRRDFPRRFPMPLDNFFAAMSIAHLTVRLRDVRAAPR